MSTLFIVFLVFWAFFFLGHLAVAKILNNRIQRDMPAKFTLAYTSFLDTGIIFMLIYLLSEC